MHEALTAGRRVEAVLPAPTPEEAEARQSVALVLRSDHEHALDRIKELQDERGRLIEECNAALMARDKDITELNERVGGLQNELGRAQGQLEALQRERLPTRTVLQLVAAITLLSAIIFTVLLLVFR